MDKKTINKINELNKEFYLKTQEYFNTTRQYSWAGWDSLLSYLPVSKTGSQSRTLRVLDVGCGNGRFGGFLISKGIKIDYVGIDSNQYLLNVAQKKVPKGLFIYQDILKPIKLKPKFDLVVLFGVLHHVPGRKTRMSLLKKLAKLLSNEGLLVFTNWHFNKLKRFNSYSVSIEKVGLSKNLMEKGDKILDWKKGMTAYRYCNLMPKSEVEEIKNKLGLKLIDEYTADAKSGQGNRYLILKLED